MPNPVNTGGIIGIDNVSPLYDPDRSWRSWNIEEIYLGEIASNKYVPKINDIVYEIIGTSITRYIVMDINTDTLVPVLQKEDTNKPTDTFNEHDILYGVGPGTQSDTYRIYIDKSVAPYRLSVDARLSVAGTMCKWCKIFKGSVVSHAAVVVSRMYDSNGILLSENVPLELAGDSLVLNVAIKTVSPCYTNMDLDDGELVTAVFYDDQGFVVSKRQLLVENTSFIRAIDASAKYIVAIGLKSPFLSNTNSKLIQFPLNVPMQSLNLTGVVTYSNGETKEYAVDGNKFSVYGFEQYIATQVGQKIKVVLKYNLSSNEVNYISNIGTERHVSEIYDAVTLNIDGSFNVKLYAYPVWIDAVSGYRLEWYMYNLDRNIHYNVTPYVSINNTVSVYIPTAYGTLQRLNAQVNIRDVNAAYKNYIHAQTIDIILSKQGTERFNNWQVGFNPDQNPKFGVDLYATAYFHAVNNWKVKVSCGFTTIERWMNSVFWATKPLYHPMTEIQAPDPTHFILVINGARHEYPIINWNIELTINGSIFNSSTIFLEFIRRNTTTDLNLTVAAMPIYYSDSAGNLL